jgi:hypothetical protein
MKKDSKNVLIIFSITLIAILILVLALILVPKKPSELYEGNSAEKFCLEKCPPNQYYTSNNNSEFNFIRCVCVTGVKYSHSEKIGSSDSPKTKTTYFDSITEFEVPEEMLIKIIKEKI